MKKLHRFFICVLLSLVLATQLAGTAFAATDDVKEAVNGVVRVLTFYDVDLYLQSDGSYLGTGTTIGSGSAFGVGTVGKETDVFVSNRHVVASDDDVVTVDGEAIIRHYTATSYYILLDDYAYNTNTQTLDTSRCIPCTVIYLGATDDEDVAILRAAEPVSGRVALALQDEEDSLEVGDAVWALGYPGTSDSATNDDYLLGAVDRVTMTNGEVSRFFDSTSATASGGLLSGRLIQHTAAVNPGNSGGPLVDANGTVVGINTYVISSSSSNVTSAYYTLRIQYAKNALDSLNIDYDVYGSANYIPLIIGAVVLVALAAAAVVVFVRRKPGAAPRKAAGAQPDAKPRFQGVSGTFAGKRYSINGTVHFGRNPAGNDIVYPANTQGVSGVHCTLSYQDGKLYLQDLGSTYGTFLGNGQKLSPNQKVELHMGDRFYLGSEREMFAIVPQGGV